MTKENRVYEVVKEYVLCPDELDHAVHARIYKDTTEDVPGDEFTWAVSHYCSLKEGAGVYIPSKTTCKRFEDAEPELLFYLKSFTSIGVVPNEHY
ncbi:MAG: hypothetical protein ACYSWO_13965 [Planctomycetota bacterium]|jgi:hypothetical protein